MIRKNSSIMHLESIDPVLGTVIKKVKLNHRILTSNHFESLVESIVSQQLSVKAADTIFLRFLELFPKTNFPSPAQIVTVDTEKVRSVGLSYSKVKYIKDLALKIENGTLNLKTIDTLDNQGVIDHLTQVKGIGQWTAEMFLMFSLGREDVFSYGDQGLKNAIKKLYTLNTFPTPKQAEEISSKWKPYRTLACRYLWASLELK